MVQATKASEIGLGQATQICNMSAKQRFEFIAEGLPIIFESAQSLIKAAQVLKDFPREAQILEGHAEEECAKILILIDIIRCPKKLVASRIGPMMKWFYDHLARLIYAEAQTWKPVSVTQLQEYVDTQRQSHYLEGEYSEYIFPNWTLFSRESALYADVIGNEDDDPVWNSPVQDVAMYSGGFEPTSYEIISALATFGVFSLSGLKILHDVWGKTDFKGDQDWGVSSQLCDKMVSKLQAAQLITELGNEDLAHVLYNRWQMPMYHIDFSKISMSLEELKERRELNMPWD